MELKLVQADTGIGGTPNNANVDYLGKRVQMTPTRFLELAAPLGAPRDSSLAFLRSKIQAGEPIGQPFLSIDIPSSWEINDLTKPAKIEGHEGRHRAWAIGTVINWDYMMEVHLFFPGLRARHITDEWMQRLNATMINEIGILRTGPFFR